MSSQRTQICSTLRMGGSMSMPLEQARTARLAASCSGMVSAVMRSREGELFARVISCRCKACVQTQGLAHNVAKVPGRQSYVHKRHAQQEKRQQAWLWNTEPGFAADRASSEEG